MADKMELEIDISKKTDPDKKERQLKAYADAVADKVESDKKE
jgi:hypothetical protein